MRSIFALFLWLVSIGWLAPTYLYVQSYFNYQRNEVQEHIWHGHAGPDSFPHLTFAWSNFQIAFGWFSVVAAGWIFYLIRQAISSPAKVTIA